ncbi:hypothetical protein L6452_08763 [Arctium lappa]|uniref:Uncharacterized protein n=1 Tax=Arctium lappa TaxID=4217 RepID=A0ACB9DIT9_ARCLA|nr:hypothetical protein L6452_08763 [Arctium lappa]
MLRGLKKKSSIVESSIKESSASIRCTMLFAIRKSVSGTSSKGKEMGVEAWEGRSNRWHVVFPCFGLRSLSSDRKLSVVDETSAVNFFSVAYIFF